MTAGDIATATGNGAEPPHLRIGCGSGEPGDRCAMQEYRARHELDPSVDTIPDDVCPVLGRFVIAAQDRNETFRTWIAANLERLANTRSTPMVEVRRAFVLLDSSVREQFPVIVDELARRIEAEADEKLKEHGAKLRGHATALRELPELTYKPLPPGVKFTFSLARGKDVPDGDRFAAWGSDKESKRMATSAASDLTGGKYRDLIWTTKASDNADEWGVWWKIEGPEGARALARALALALDLARDLALALARALALALDLDEPLGKLAIAAFERALAITEASAPAEEVGGSAATDEAGRDGEVRE